MNVLTSLEGPQTIQQSHLNLCNGVAFAMCSNSVSRPCPLATRPLLKLTRGPPVSHLTSKDSGVVRKGPITEGRSCQEIPGILGAGNQEQRVNVCPFIRPPLSGTSRDGHTCLA